MGRDLIENNYYEQPPKPLKLPADHPLRQYTITDVVAALIGNELTGEPGLVARIVMMESKLAEMQGKQKELGESQIASQIERHVLIDDLDDLKRSQNPRWFQVLAVAMALVLIVLLLLVLMRMR